MLLWEPIDVTAWTEFALEPRGRRPKRWLRSPDGEVWLRKTPTPIDPKNLHTARRSEPAIEVLALELARRCGLDAADTRPARYTINGAEERCVVSRRFHADDEDQHPGNELLDLPGESGLDPEEKQRKRASATLGRAREKLLSLEHEHGVEFVRPFVRMLAIDAWLGNGDRHSGNWAVITGPRGARLSPIYDSAACLGVELTDERPVLVAPSDALIDRYVARCPSGFGGGEHDGREGVPMTEVLAELACWPEWRPVISELLPRFRDLTERIDEVLRAIPDEWLSPARKRFAARVLAGRVRLLDEG